MGGVILRDFSPESLAWTSATADNSESVPRVIPHSPRARRPRDSWQDAGATWDNRPVATRQILRFGQGNATG
jgi:hypothetical protein